MAGIGLAPCRSMVAEDIRNLQPWTRHARRASGGRLDRRHDLRHGLGYGLGYDLRHGLGRIFFGHQRREAIQRAHDLADGVGGDAGVERRGVEFGMTQRSCAIIRILLSH